MLIADKRVIDVGYDDLFSHSSLLAIFEPYLFNTPTLTKSDSLWNTGLTIEDVADYNRDGWDDIFLQQGGAGMAPAILLSDAVGGAYSLASIIGDAAVEIVGEAFSADFDGDGDLDIFATVNGQLGTTDKPGWEYQFGASGGSLFLRNDGSQFKAIKVESAFFNQTGIDLQYEHGGHFADIDNDGDLDIFSIEANSRFGPDAGVATQRTYLVNDGEGNFTHSQTYLPKPTTELGIPSIRFADLNNDGISDYVVSTSADGTADTITDYLAHNGLHVYINDGDGDISNDKLIRIAHHWIEKYEDFSDIPIAAGTAFTEEDVGDPDYKTDFGPGNDFTSFVDVNNDGYLDIINGQKLYNPYHGTGGGFQLYINEKGGSFREATIEYFPNLDIYQSILEPALPDITRVTSADFNGDGALDLVFEQGEGTSSDWSEPEYPFILLNYDDKFYPLSMANALGLVSDARGGDSLDTIAGNLIAGDFNGDGASDLVAITPLREQDGEYIPIDKGNGTDWGITVHYGKTPEPLELTVRGTGRSDKLQGTKHNELFIPGLGADEVDAGEGVDTALYWANRDEFELNYDATGFYVWHGTKADRLVGVERLEFADKHIAIDIDGHAGQTAKLLGAVFGAEAVTNIEYTGIGLELLDSGYSYRELAKLALDASGALTNTEVCELLWENVVGDSPDPEEIAPYLQMLDNPEFSAADLAVLAADTSLNAENIRLTVLYQTGLAFQLDSI